MIVSRKLLIRHGLTLFDVRPNVRPMKSDVKVVESGNELDIPHGQINPTVGKGRQRKKGQEVSNLWIMVISENLIVLCKPRGKFHHQCRCRDSSPYFPLP